MADSATTSDSFSLEKFLELYSVSPAVKNLSYFEVKDIDKAIKEKDFGFLRKFYIHLKQEEESNKEIDKNFLKERIDIIDEFDVAVMEIEKEHFGEPKKEEMARVEKEEREAAENILKKIKT